MTEAGNSAQDERLRRVALDLILGNRLDVESAVRLAEDLVISGRGGAATVAVAVLARDVWASDAEQPVRDMLAEHGMDVPTCGPEQDAYQLLLQALAYWDLPLHIFEGHFYRRIPAWDEQSPLDRSLVVLLDRRDHEATPWARDHIEQEMRDVVRKHVSAT